MAQAKRLKGRLRGLTHTHVNAHTLRKLELALTPTIAYDYFRDSFTAIVPILAVCWSQQTLCDVPNVLVNCFHASHLRPLTHWGTVNMHMHIFSPWALKRLQSWNCSWKSPWVIFLTFKMNKKGVKISKKKSINLIVKVAENVIVKLLTFFWLTKCRLQMFDAEKPIYGPS